VNWIMPGSDGIEVCHRIKTHPGLAALPTVVMVTAKHRDKVTGPAEQAGIAGVLLKPIRTGDLLDVVSEICGHDSSLPRRRLVSSGVMPAVQPALGARILVAEDDETNQMVTREVLENAGLEVTIVSNGEEAVQEATRRRYDLVLMDVHMPRCDGPAATVALRADPQTARVPIIAMTADVLEETRRRCLVAGMNDFVMKPISVSELVTKVVRWIDPVSATPTRPEQETAATESDDGTSVDEPLARAADDALRSSTRVVTFWSRLIGLGIPSFGPIEQTRRRRLANGLVLVLIAVAAVYAPAYAAAGLPEIAVITGAMGVLWLVAYALMIRGWHRSGRFLVVLVGLVGCAAYAIAFGPRANYHALLFNGMTMPAIVFTFRERRLCGACSLAAVGLWLVAESGVLAPFAVVAVSDAVYALLHANAALICIGFLAFTVYFLARENHQVEDRLQAANTCLQAQIEERSRAEKALVQERERAEDARLAKSEFLANMSHEIRTPMHAILGLTELSLRSQLTPGVRDQISRIESAALALLRIINEILDLSRLEAQRIELEWVDFSLEQVLEQLESSLGHVARRKGVELLVVLDQDVPGALRGDPLRLEQVLSNLADNAVNATEQGEVEVRVERRIASPGHADLRFSVSDTGIGFPVETIEQYCETVSRIDRHGCEQRRGLGLGLIISRSLVELMGGELQVASERGVGSKFWFEVQLECGEREKAVDSSASLATAMRRFYPVATGSDDLVAAGDEIPLDLRHSERRICGARILVAEDNDANQLVARGILEDLGLRVDLVGTGREALEAVAGTTFDLVLMDLHMPEMDGYEAAMRIRQNPDNAELPIIAMTADSRQETRRGCTEAGMNGYVAKPVDRLKLLASLVRWIEPTNDGEHEGEGVRPAAETPGDEVVLPTRLPGIDLREALERMCGRHRSLIDVLRVFAHRYRGREAEIEEAWRRGEVERALQLAHLGKGSAGNISAHDLYAASAGLEKAIRSGDEASVPGLITEHRRALDQVMGSLAIVEYSCLDRTAAAESRGSAEEVDPQVLRSQLEELIRLLAARSLRARPLVHELRNRLDGTARGQELEAVAEDVRELDFSSARDKVVGFVHRYGIGIQGVRG
jgi:CheY-like chemotaxis protein/HPt (histidine-containing phosphotransfer) domain-containing protein